MNKEQRALVKSSIESLNWLCANRHAMVRGAAIKNAKRLLFILRSAKHLQGKEYARIVNKMMNAPV